MKKLLAYLIKSVFGNSSKQNNMWGIPSKEQEQKNKDGKKAFSLDFDNKTEEAELLTEQELHNLAEMAGLAKSTPAQDLSDILSGTYASKRTHQVAAAEEDPNLTFALNLQDYIKKGADILNLIARREFDNDYSELSDEDRAKVKSLKTFARAKVLSTNKESSMNVKHNYVATSMMMEKLHNDLKNNEGLVTDLSKLKIIDGLAYIGYDNYIYNGWVFTESMKNRKPSDVEKIVKYNQGKRTDIFNTI